MKAIPAIGALLIGAPVMAQPQSGAQPATPQYVHPAPTLPNWAQPSTTPGQTSSNPWSTLPEVSPYRNLAEEIGAVSTHNELRAPLKKNQASDPKSRCDAAKGEACPTAPKN